MQTVLCESADRVGAQAADIIEAMVRQGPAQEFNDQLGRTPTTPWLQQPALQQR